MKKAESLENLLNSHPMVDKVRVIVAPGNVEKELLNILILAKNNQLRSNYIIEEFLKKHLNNGVILNKILWVNNVEELNQITSVEDTNTEQLVQTLDTTEAYVFNIWKELLKTENFTVNDTFFEIGGDSLKCVQVLFRLNLKYPDITLTDLFTFTSIKELADYIDDLNGEKSSTDARINLVKF